MIEKRNRAKSRQLLRNTKSNKARLVEARSKVSGKHQTVEVSVVEGESILSKTQYCMGRGTIDMVLSLYQIRNKYQEQIMLF